MEPSPLPPQKDRSGLVAAALVTLVFAAVGFGDGPTPEELAGDLVHENADRRERAVEALGKLRRGDLATALEPLIEDPERDVQREVVRAIGIMGNPESLPAIARALERKSLQEKAIEAIAELGSLRGVALLEELLESPDEDARKDAAKALRSTEGWRMQWQVRDSDGVLYGDRSEVFPDPAWLGPLERLDP